MPMDIVPERLFRLLADTTRLQSVLLLHSEGRLCVCELTHALDLSQPKISRHLAQLRTAGLLVDERQGQWVHYRLADDLPDWVHRVIEAAATHHSWRAAQRRLDGMPNRPPLDDDRIPT
ncbi:transcriptional regulator [Halorhodospira abdelmalekii]|uniref:metalloregulator ArsR/SmtB family transcription factor n=1 Tax=Halorhodospira abdelmalekii TaxID=421629 RepID=UPI001906A722|nr:metalloregulator ArsR/SmtB family transcription factor [Halorhodospira abdelmalekii]MBK1734918.1 transcriptional regulator [Halorhodospira abdelmalekii]